MSRIRAWGNSHGVRLSREVLEAAGLSPDAEVTVRAEPGRIVIQAARPKPSLDELLARVRRSPRSSEADYGLPRGKEVL